MPELHDSKTQRRVLGNFSQKSREMSHAIDSFVSISSSGSDAQGAMGRIVTVPRFQIEMPYEIVPAPELPS
jgi:hypothetical protein